MSSIGKTILIAANPKSGASDRSSLVSELAARLNSLGYITKVESELEKFRESALHGQQTGELHGVIAAGGDGTVSAVIDRIHPEVPLGILALGTENLLAKYLNLPSTPEGLVSVIQRGHTEILDAGSANGKLFLIMLSAGFDSEVVRLVHSSRKGHIQHSTYVLPILKTMFSYPFPKISLRLPSEGREVSCRWFFGFNIPRYARNLPFAPQADPTDGKLDLAIFERGGLLRGLWYFFHLWRGKHTSLVDFQSLQSTSLVLSSDSPVPFQIDGDAAGFLPVEIKLLPARVRIWT